MAHANVINNQLVSDAESSFENKRFSSRIASRFKLHVDKFEERCSEVPPGWHTLMKDAVRMLRAVDCPKRNGIEFSEPRIVRGELRIGIYFAPTDKVVRGIIQKLIKKTTCTCQICGSGIGTIFRQGSEQTLCARCHVHTDLYSELAQWLEARPAQNLYKSRPLFVFSNLPKNIQFVIPRERVRSLYLSAQDKPLQYVTPADVQTQAAKLALMMRCLNQVPWN